MSIYLELTRKFNSGRTRVVLTSGQAVVLHRLAVMSKDGDWIVREDDEALEHVRSVLESYGAHYRFGAPLDAHWLTNGWSSHFEFPHSGLRVRADFFSRPPRVERERLARVWRESEGRDPAFVDVVTLARMKQTDREKDYPVIGELARMMTDPRDQLLYSRSARDLVALAREHADLVGACVPNRPLLAQIGEGRERLEQALDAERRALMRENEIRLEEFERSAASWKLAWLEVHRAVEGLPLRRAHAQVVARALGILPFSVGGAP